MRRPLPVVTGPAADDAIDGLMREHPHLAHHIRTLASEFLRYANGRVRDGRNGARRTYDIGFVDDRRQFGCLTAEPGKFDRATDGQLQVQLLYQGNRDIRPFKRKDWGGGKRGWHEAELAEEDDAEPLLAAIRAALA